MKFFSNIEFKLFVTFVIIYFYFVHWTGGNENSRFALIRSIVDENTIKINSYYNTTNDRALFGGDYYSDKAPGMSFLGVPTYAIWKFIYFNLFPKSFIEKHASSEEYEVRMFNKIPIYLQLNPGFFLTTSMILLIVITTSLFSALTVVLVYKISVYFTKKEKDRLLVTFTYALATLAFPFGSLFFEHATSTFLAFLAFYLLFKMKQDNKTNNKVILLVGLILGFTAVVELTSLIVITILSLYVLSFKTRKEILPILLLGILVGLLPSLIYNYSIFGNPFELTLQHNDPFIWNIQPEELQTYGFTSFIPNIFISYRLTFDTYRGLFFYYPILLLSLIGLFKFYKKHKMEAFIILLLLFSYISLFSTRHYWWGAYTFGPRYLLNVVPFLMLPLIYGFDIMEKKNQFKIVWFLVGLSIFVNILSLQHWEDMLLSQRTLLVDEKYQSRLNTFHILENPIFSYYIPSFFETGPRSRIFENIVNGRIEIDIRDEMDFINGANGIPKFVTLFVPFLSVIPLNIILLLLWKKEILNIFSGNRKLFKV